MAIPQPGFVGTKDSFRQGLNQGAANRTAAVGSLASTVGGNRQLGENQRQFNVNKVVNLSDQIVKNNYDGDYARFLRGDRLQDGSYSGSPLAVQLFTSIYGDKGVENYNKAVAKIGQTGEQITRETLDYFLRYGDKEAGIEPAFTGTPAGYTPSDGAQGTPRGPRRTDVPMSSNVPGAAQGGTTGPAQAPVGYMPSSGATPGETLRYGDWERDTKPSNGYSGQSPAVIPEGQLLRGDAFKQAENEATYAEDFNRLTKGAGNVQQEGQYAMNDRGMPVGEGQEGAALPLNTATIPKVYDSLQIPAGTPPGDIATALAQRAKEAGGGDAAYDLMAKKTSDLVKEKEANSEVWQEYDRQAQEVFGVDGDTFFSMRNQMFDNVEKGRPLSYIPTEEEQKDLWWWSGKNMPVEAKLEDFNSTEQPNMASMTSAVDSVRKVDVASLDAKGAASVNQFLDKSRKMMIESVVNNEDVARNVATSVGLSGASSSDMQQVFDNSTRKPLFVATEEGLGISLPEASARIQRLTGRVIDSSTAIYKGAAKKIKGAYAAIKSDSREEKLNNGEVPTVEETMAISMDRQREIYNELKNFQAGEGPVSVEVEMSIPMEERQHRAALDQFDRRMDLSERQFKETQSVNALNKELAYADLVMKRFEINARAASSTAVANGELPPNWALLYDNNKEIVTSYRDAMWQAAAGDPKAYEKLYAQALTVPEFQKATESVSSILAGITNLPVETATFLEKKRWLLGDKTTEGTLVGAPTAEQAATSYIPAGTMSVPSSTVNSGSVSGTTMGAAGAGGAAGNDDAAFIQGLNLQQGVAP